MYWCVFMFVCIDMNIYIYSICIYTYINIYTYTLEWQNCTFVVVDSRQCVGGTVSVLAPFSHDRGQMISHWLFRLFHQNGSFLIGGGLSHMFHTSQWGNSWRLQSMTGKLHNTRGAATVNVKPHQYRSSSTCWFHRLFLERTWRSRTLWPAALLWTSLSSNTVSMFSGAGGQPRFKRSDVFLLSVTSVSVLSRYWSLMLFHTFTLFDTDTQSCTVYSTHVLFRGEERWRVNPPH